MIRKVIAVVLVATTILSMCSCTRVRRSGKRYINRSDKFIVDGFNYWTEKKQTDNFIAFKDTDGKVMLFPVNEEKDDYYDPDGLCDIVPGGMYKITYDVQHVSGGFAGVREAYFLAVYDCREVDTDTLFENGYKRSRGFWPNSSLITSSIDGADFIALKDEDGGYDLYSETYGKRHYDEARAIKFMLEFEDSEPVEMEFNVFCNKNLTDEYILDRIMSGKAADEEGFVLFDADHPGDTAKDTDYDSIEKAAVGSCYWKNIMFFRPVYQATEETRRLITYEDMMTKTSDELGLDNNVYDKLHSAWEDMNNGTFENRSVDPEPKKHCDILLFCGDYGTHADMKYDVDLKIQIDDHYNYEEDPTVRYQYVALFIRCEFNDLLPQD